MLEAAVVNECLHGAVGSGILAALLLDEEGVLLSSASSSEEYSYSRERTMIIAAIGNVWRASAQNDLAKSKITNELEPEALEQVLIDFGSKKLCAMSVGGKAILCLVGYQVEMGLLKLKTAAVQRRLDVHLRPALVAYK
ncbi:hypothetical protein, conserved [Trypanosoma brucei gambiense DAL972]|nr:hypothetical protein, conserved [Trypanosoma brucei gambiense DAL972]CBH14506.1 hypothetical protein, conserved [Trypanosoma brucei gambiense DAL972]|eukprot:XP_011776772.1 hypothetical protein, conserved [Trypanosoma brucei gambiense DAL972]